MATTLASLRLFGLYAFALALPFNLWSVQAGLALVTLGLVGESIVRRRAPALPRALVWPIALYLVAIALSWPGSGEDAPSLHAALGFWPVLAPLVLAAAIPDLATLRRLWLCVGVVAALMGLYGALQHFTGVDWFRVHTHIARPAPDAPGRFLAIGNFEAHTTYAFALAFPALFGVALALEDRRRARWLWAAVALLASTGIVLSYVRSIWLGLALGLGVMALVRRGPALKLAVAVGAAAVVTVALVPSLRARAVSIVDVRYNVGRTYIWERSWRMLADHPATGIGFATYRDLQDAYFDPAAPPDEVPRTGAHSTYLHIAVETGALGLGAFLWLWLAVFREGLRAWRKARSSSGRAALLGGLASVACFLWGSFFQESFYDGEVAFALWLAVSSVFVAAREEHAPEAAA